MRKIKGVSPIISVLLLIVIAVAAAVVTYGFVMGFIGGTTTTTTGVTQARILVTAGVNQSDYLEVYVTNVGQIPVTVSAIYLYNASSMAVVNATTTISVKVLPGATEAIHTSMNVTKPGTYYVKVTTAEGAVATSEAFTVG